MRTRCERVRAHRAPSSEERAAPALPEVPRARRVPVLVRADHRADRLQLQPRQERHALDRLLDPLVQREFYDLLKEEKEGGKTVFLSSHILPEVERVCDRVGILRDGLLVAVENVDDLKTRRVRKLEITLKEYVPEEKLNIPGTKLLYYRGKHVELEVYGHIGDFIPKLAELPLEDIVFPEATLEDTFMKFYREEPTG